MTTLSYLTLPPATSSLLCPNFLNILILHEGPSVTLLHSNR